MQQDHELIDFELYGLVVPDGTPWQTVVHDGAALTFASLGSGPAVLLLHGGLGHSGNWGRQIPALVGAGYRVVFLDTRGHGRSTRDDRRYSYDLLADDALAVLDALGVEHAALVGWSDGACTALAAARRAPDRVRGVFFFACNVDSTGTLPFEMTPVIGRCFSRHTQDYRALNPTPDDWERLVADVGLMQRTQPEYTPGDLASIRVPLLVVHAEGDEFIRREHAEYLASSVPGSSLTLLPGVTHFAPLQRPELFNAVLLEWLRSLSL